MLRHLKIDGDRLVEATALDGSIAVYVAPDETERRYLIETLRVDEHTLNSALDPDELSRLEFEPDHVAVILKRPKRYSAADGFLFRVGSTGAFLFKDRLVVVISDDAPLFEGRPFVRVTALHDIILRLLYRAIHHFEEHLKAINLISEELETEVNKAMENKHLLNFFTLEKSLTYYVNAASSNARLIEKLRASTAKIGFTPESLEYMDDLTIENTQCLEQAQIYSSILASLMDARASIVANNLNILMKNLNIIMIALMLPTLVVSVFSMNVALPVPQNGGTATWPFWFVVAIATLSAAVVGYLWKQKRF